MESEGKNENPMIPLYPDQEKEPARRSFLKSIAGAFAVAGAATTEMSAQDSEIVSESVGVRDGEVSGYENTAGTFHVGGLSEVINHPRHGLCRILLKPNSKKALAVTMDPDLTQDEANKIWEERLSAISPIIGKGYIEPDSIDERDITSPGRLFAPIDKILTTVVDKKTGRKEKKLLIIVGITVKR